jgi:alpha-L-fucosidase 2
VIGADPKQKNVMWFKHPAENWTEAMPVGNGRIGAMVYGGARNEKLKLNEETLWDRPESNGMNPDALTALPEVQRLIFEGRISAAEKLAEEKMLARPLEIESYKPLGDTDIDLVGDGAITEYRRELDLDLAIASTRYRLDGTVYTREVFSTAPDQVIVLHQRCDGPGRLTMRVSLSRQ